MAFDLENWIKGLELPEAERSAVIAAIGKGGDKTLKFLEGNQLRQDEFSRKLNAEQERIKALEKDLTTKIAKEDEFATSLSTWKTGSEKKLKDATAAREKAEQSLSAARDRAKKLAEEFSIPDEQLTELFKEAPVVTHDIPPNRTESNDPDPRYVTREMFQVEARSYAKLATLIPSLEREHFRLFGQETNPPDWEKLIEDTIATGGKKTLAQVYSETYKVEDKRKELANADVEARINKARQEGADAERAKLLADNPAAGEHVRRDERQGSPILDLARKQAADAAKDKAPPARIISPVEAAVRSFNEGKYKGGVEKVA